MQKLKQLDQVTITTTTNVGWMSAPPGQVTNPKGVWVVVGILEDHVIVQKEQTLAKVPIIDVVKVAEYNIHQPLQKIKELTHVRHRRDDNKRQEASQENL